MNLKIANVLKYAQGTAPIAGIPIAGVGTIVLLRRHLRAALDIQPSRIIYNLDTKTKPDPDLFKINYDKPDLQNTR